MKLNETLVFFFVVTAVLMLLVASPALSRLPLLFPRSESFSELLLRGPNDVAEDFPFNISRGQDYSIYLGLGNHLGYCAYYVVEVKFRNETQSAPVGLGPFESGSPSSLPALFNVTAFVADGASWELPLTFSFDYAFDESLMLVEFHSLTLNGAVLGLDGYSAAWNSTARCFFGTLFFEAWLYSVEVGSFQYHERFVELSFNMTV